jgi:S1-C subfamily serine protease
VAAHSYSASLTAVGHDRLELDGYGAAGMSGSPLFSAEGKVVGVVYGGSRSSVGGLLFAVPVRQVRELLGNR